MDMLITPAQIQTHLLELFNAGWESSSTVGEPGAHGAGTTGTQGIGVSTPSAAAVAAATVGLARELHMPKGGMLTIGRWSMMLAARTPAAIVRWIGSTFSVEGATPKLHCSMAPVTTCKLMKTPPGPVSESTVLRNANSWSPGEACQTDSGPMTDPR